VTGPKEFLDPKEGGEDRELNKEFTISYITGLKHGIQTNLTHRKKQGLC